MSDFRRALAAKAAQQRTSLPAEPAEKLNTPGSRADFRSLLRTKAAEQESSLDELRAGANKINASTRNLESAYTRAAEKRVQKTRNSAADIVPVLTPNTYREGVQRGAEAVAMPAALINAARERAAAEQQAAPWVDNLSERDTARLRSELGSAKQVAEKTKAKGETEASRLIARKNELNDILDTSEYGIWRKNGMDAPANVKADVSDTLAELDNLTAKLDTNNKTRADSEERLAKIGQVQNAARLHEYELLDSRADFAEKSAYVEPENVPSPKIVPNWDGTYSSIGEGYTTYDYINGNQGAVEQRTLNEMSDGRGALGYDSAYMKEMTKQEIARYNYLHNTEGEKAADSYLKFITPTLNARQRAAAEAEMAKYAKEHPVISSAGSILMSPLKGVGYVGQALDYLEDGKIDQNASYNRVSYLQNAIRGTVSQRWGKVGSFLYQTGMSMGDFLLNAGITGGSEGLSLAIMGTGAAADTVIEAKDRGLSDDQAFALGTIAGAAEILTEKVSLETLLNKTALNRSALGYWVKNALAEGSEEVASDLINTIADVLIAQDKSELRTAINAFISQGYSESEAVGLALKDKAAEMGVSFLGGALSGGVMAAGPAMVSGIRSNTNSRIEFAGDAQTGLAQTGIEGYNRNNGTAEPKREWARGAVVEPSAGSVEYAEQQTAKEYGIDCFVISDEAWQANRKGRADAFCSGGQIYLREGLPADLRGIAVAHESTHVMKQVGFEPYLDFLSRMPDMMDMGSKDTRELLNEMARHRGVEFATLTEAQQIGIYDELCAAIYGELSRGTMTGNMANSILSAFYDFDAFKTEIEQLHSDFKGWNRERSVAYGQERVSAVDGRREQETAALAGKRKSSEERGKEFDGGRGGAVQVTGEESVRDGTDSLWGRRGGRGVEANATPNAQQVYNVREVEQFVQNGNAFGENGKKAFTSMYDGGNFAAFYSDFAANYNAGVRGTTQRRVANRYSGTLTDAQALAAYSAGKNDADASGTAEQTSTGLKVYSYAEAGLAADTASLIADEGVRSTVDKLAKTLGVRVFMDEQITPRADGSKVNGYVDSDGNMHIAADADALTTVFAHELTHRIQEVAPKEYAQYRRLVMEQLSREQGGDVNLVEQRKTEYQRGGVELSNEAATDELAADYAQRIIGDPAKFAEVANGNPNLARRLLNTLHNLIVRVKAALGSETARLERIETEWRRALSGAQRAVAAAQQTAATAATSPMTAAAQPALSYSIKTDENGGKYVEIDTDQHLFDNAPKKSYAVIARRVLMDRFAGQTLPLGENDLARLEAKQAGEYAYPRKQYDIQSAEYEAKMRASTELDNLLETAEYSHWARDTKNHKEATLGFDYYKVKFVVDGHSFEGLANIANSESGRIFYDITKIEEIPDTRGKPATGMAQSTSSFGNLDTNSISNSGEDVNAKFSRSAESIRYSIDPGFASDIDAWSRAGRPAGESFVLGSTGEVLQGLGAIESDIYMLGDKISTIMNEHSEITLDEIKRIPEVLDDPVLILKSKGTNLRGKNTRMIIYGSVKAQNGQPMLAVLDLRPVEKGFRIDDMQKVTSAYTRDNPTSLVTSSEVMYADEKRTAPLLRSIGLAITSRPLLRSGSIGSISYSGTDVNLKGEKFSDVVRVGEAGNTKFSLSLEENLTAASGTAEQTSTGLKVYSYAEAGLAADTASLIADEGVRSTVDKLAKTLGVRVYIDETASVANGVRVNGYIADGDIHVAADADSVATVLAHELTHRIQEVAPKEYAQYRRLVMEQLSREQGGDVNLVEQRKTEYQRGGVELSNEAATDEIAADYAQRMMDDPVKFAEVANGNPNLARRLLNTLHNLIVRVKAALGSETARLERIETEWRRALSGAQRTVAAAQQTAATAATSPMTAAAQPALSYSIKYDETNTPYVEIDEDILAGVPRAEWVRTVKDNMREKFPNGVTVGNNEIAIDKQSRNEMTYSRYMQQLMKSDPAMFADKLRATNNADEIIRASRNYVNESLMHPRKDNIEQFARGEVQMRVGDNDYAAQVVVAMRSNGKLLLYDIIDMTPIEISAQNKKSNAAKSVNPSPGVGRSTASGFSTPIISEAGEDVNAKFSRSAESIRYSISPEFASDIDAWSRAGRPAGESFVLGSTGEVLQGLGTIESDIYMLGDKISTIMNEHPEITLDEIKRIPEVLDDPVLILKSKGENRRGQNTRMVIFGTVKAQNGQPMLAVLDLRPVEGNLVIDDMQKVSSAHTRDNSLSLVMSSEVMYADEKRTAPLLRSMGLQSRPIELQRSGSIGSISYNQRSVNLKGEKFSDVVRVGEAGNTKFSLSLEENLTAASGQDIITDEERGAILQYKSSESFKINAALRDGEMTARDEMFIRSMDNALDGLPVYRGTVYRNISFDDVANGAEQFANLLDEHQKGQRVSYKAYTSASTVVDGYPVEGKNVVHFVIEGLSAKNVDGIGNNVESEVVFARNAEFIVTSREANGDGSVTIHMEEVEESAKRGEDRRYEQGGARSRLGGNNSGEQGSRHGQGTAEVQSLQAQAGVLGKVQEVSGFDSDASRDGGMPGVRAEGVDERFSLSGQKGRSGEVEYLRELNDYLREQMRMTSRPRMTRPRR